MSRNKRVLPPLRRYTTLPALLDLLQEKRLTLVSPSAWIDRNDSFYLEQYKLGRNAKSVLALCLSEAGETFHHWRVFTQGSDGVCIQFHRDVLLGAVSGVENLLHGPVEYVEINKAKTPTLGRLPFLKRFPYRDEKEFRLVHIDLENEIDFKCIPVPLEAIYSITLSPWLPENLRSVVSETICSVAGCAVQVSNTTLLDNQRWKNLGRQCCAASDEDDCEQTKFGRPMNKPIRIVLDRGKGQSETDFLKSLENTQASVARHGGTIRRVDTYPGQGEASRCELATSFEGVSSPAQAERIRSTLDKEIDCQHVVWFEE